MEIRAYFDEVRQASRALDRCSWEIERARSRCERLSELVRKKTAGAAGPRLDRQLALLTDREAALREREERLERLEQDAVALLAGLKDEKSQRLLLLRYVELLPWAQVRSALEREGFYYCERQVFNLHRKALEQAQALLDGRVS